MVKTRRRIATTAATKRKSAKQTKSNKVSTIKKQQNCIIDGKQNLTKLPQNLSRCKDWIQQQKREKLKVQLDDLDSNESDDERDINLATISVNSHFCIWLCRLIYFNFRSLFFIERFSKIHLRMRGTLRK